MKPVPHGEPYAEKLHVRFDEGAGVPDNKGRPALLYTLLLRGKAFDGGIKKMMSFTAFCLVIGLWLLTQFRVGVMKMRIRRPMKGTKESSMYSVKGIKCLNI